MGRFVVLALAISLAASGRSAAQARPEDVAHAVLRADSAGDWSTLLLLAHPEGLKQFLEQQVTMVSMDRESSFAPMDSCMRQAFGEAFGEQMDTQRQYTLDSVFRVPSLDSLQRLRPDSAFARYARHIAGQPTPMDPHAPITRILGSLKGPKGAAYAIVHEAYPIKPFPDWPDERVQIMTLKERGGRWLSMLDGPVRLNSGGSAMIFSHEE